MNKYGDEKFMPSEGKQVLCPCVAGSSLLHLVSVVSEQSSNRGIEDQKDRYVLQVFTYNYEFPGLHNM